MVNIYVYAKEPMMDSKEAMRKSKALTKGHKANIFILDVSFFFWNLLDLVSLGLASYFIQPYKLATNARLFNVLVELENAKA